MLNYTNENLRCTGWNGTEGISAEVSILCHAGYGLLGLAFTLPSFCPLYDGLILRTLATLGTSIFIVWSKYDVCSLDIMLWNIGIVMINLTYTLTLIKKHFPVGVPKELRELYIKLFYPFKMSKRQFRDITRNSKIRMAKKREELTRENSTPRESPASLSILMSGKLKVKCEGVTIHVIRPYEFVDSVEFGAAMMKDRESEDCLFSESKRESRALKEQTAEEGGNHVYQVSVEADEDSVYLELCPETLMSLSQDTLRILECLIGKDICDKLYNLSELGSLARGEESKMGGEKSKNPQKGSRKKSGTSSRGGLRVLDFHRTVSLDAMDTGCKGYVRSTYWINKSERAKKEVLGDEKVLVLNFELDVPPTVEYLPHDVPVHTIDKSTMAEAQFLAQQRKYWPSGFI